MPLYEDVYHWSAIKTAVRFLPCGIVSGVVAAYSPRLIAMGAKWSILLGVMLNLAATLLLPFADRRDRYWSLVFPSQFLGTSGSMIIITNSSIALFTNTPPEIAGTIGAIYNAGLQLGCALGLAVVTSITTSLDAKKRDRGEEVGYGGIAAGYWFVVAFCAVEALAILVFWKNVKTPALDEENAIDDASSGTMTPGAGETRSEKSAAA